MRRHLLFITLCLFILNANAQPILKADSVNAVAGDTSRSHFGKYVSPGNPGANQIWDISAIVELASFVTPFVSTASTPYASSFPSANLALDARNVSIAPWTFNYFKTTATAWQDYGYVTTDTIILSHTDPEDEYRYPFTYGNSFTDTFAATYLDKDGTTRYYFGTVNVTADGYGTLITHENTFHNVLRMHYVRIKKDSVSGFPADIDHNDYYTWTVNGIHGALARIGIESYGSNIDSIGSYISDPSDGIKEQDDAYTFFLYPNPAGNQLIVSSPQSAIRNSIINIYNLIGQKTVIPLFWRSAGGEAVIDISSFSSGIYFLQLKTESGVVVKKFVKSANTN